MSQPQGQPPAQGYPQPGPPPAQTTVVVQPTAGAGGCPSCHVGYIREDYTMIGICLAIVFFPLGLLCCLAMKEKKCSHCGATF